MSRVISPVHGYCWRKHSSDDNGSIMLYVSYRGRKERSTGYSVAKGEWDQARQRVKPKACNATLINAKLGELSNNIEKKILDMSMSGKPWSVDAILSVLGRNSQPGKLLFSEVHDRYFAAKQLSKSSMFVHNRLRRAFIKHLGNISVLEFDEERMQRFANCMLKEWANATVEEVLRRLKAVLTWSQNAIDERIPNPILKYNFRKIANKEQRLNRSLSEKQIGRMQHWLRHRTFEGDSTFLSLSGQAKLSKRRSQEFAVAFYLCMYYLSGLAPVDMADLKVSDIRTDGKVQYFEKPRKKTGVKFFVVIPDEPIFTTIFNFFVSTAGNRGGYIFPLTRWKRNNSIRVTPEQEFVRLRSIIKTMNPTLQEAIRDINRKYLGTRIPTDTTLYSARHSFATTFLSKSANIRLLCSAMGRSPNTISTYISQLTAPETMSGEIKNVFARTS